MPPMRLIDLTHALRPDMPVLPGDPRPEIADVLTLERDACAVQSLRMSNHLGTHLDAPAHFIPGGRTVEQVPLETLAGEAVLVDFTDKPAGGRIELEELLGRLPSGTVPSRLLIKTGWDRFFTSDRYFQGFPVLSLEAAQLLAEQGLLLLGLDTPSPSPLDDPGQRIHHALLGAGTVILEAAANLTRIPGASFQLTVLPLPLAGCSGAPCRAIAACREA